MTSPIPLSPVVIRTMIAIGLLVIASAGVPAVAAPADETVIVMVSGERFISNAVWEEEGKIRFNMQGLVVSVPMDEVAQIIRRPVEHLPQAGAGPLRSDTTHRQRPTDNALLASRPPSSVESQRESVRSAAPMAPSPYAEGFPAHSGIPTGNKSGLPQIAWRMPNDQLPDREPLAPDPAFGGIEQYWRPEHPLVFGEALLDGLVYGFWRNQLYSIVMWAEGRIGYERLRKAVFDQFGRGRRGTPDTERFLWDEGATQRMLEFDTALNTGIFIMRSGELHQQIRQLYSE